MADVGFELQYVYLILMLLFFLPCPHIKFSSVFSNQDSSTFFILILIGKLCDALVEMPLEKKIF